MSLVQAAGEVEEFGGGTSLVPDSFYKVALQVGPDPNVTEASETSPGGTPFIELSGEVLDGPFEATAISRRLYLTPGRVRYDDQTGEEKGGGYIMLLHGMCKQVTGQNANESVLGTYGWTEPPRNGGESDRDFGKRVRLEFARFFTTLDASQRLKLMLDYLRIPAWNGKQVIAHIGLETRPDAKGRVDDNGELLQFSNNNWSGFYGLRHPQKGEQYLAVAHARQEQALNGQTG